MSQAIIFHEQVLYVLSYFRIFHSSSNLKRAEIYKYVQFYL